MGKDQRVAGSAAAGTGTRLCETTMGGAETLRRESLKTHEKHFWGAFCPGRPGQNRHWSEGQLLGVVKVAQGMSKPGSARGRVRQRGVRNGSGVEQSTRGGGLSENRRV